MRWDPADGVTVLEPDAQGRGYWVGAPSVLDDGDRALLVYRKRRPRGEADDRGYECCIAESRDGVEFRDLWSVRNAELGSTSMERFALVRDPGGRYLLYLSFEHPEDGRRRIAVVEAGTVEELDVARAQTVLTPAGTGTAAVKDPVVVRVGGEYVMFVSTFLSDAGAIAIRRGSPRSFERETGSSACTTARPRPTRTRRSVSVSPRRQMGTRGRASAWRSRGSPRPTAPVRCATRRSSSAAESGRSTTSAPAPTARTSCA